MLSVHLRTTKEMSLVPARYQELKWIKTMRDDLSPKTLLVANGDILNRSAGLKIIADYGIDGAMIGRGIFQDPYAFSVNSQWATASQQEKIGLFKYHLELFAQWADNPDRGVKRMNKYAKIYINGFNGAKELRENIAQANTINEMLSILTTKE
jgi:tRNA-dihydrouridine synthase